MDHFGPFWSCKCSNPVQNKVILTKMVFWTILGHFGPVHFPTVPRPFPNCGLGLIHLSYSLFNTSCIIASISSHDVEFDLPDSFMDSLCSIHRATKGGRQKGVGEKEPKMRKSFPKSDRKREKGYQKVPEKRLWVAYPLLPTPFCLPPFAAHWSMSRVFLFLPWWLRWYNTKIEDAHRAVESLKRIEQEKGPRPQEIDGRNKTHHMIIFALEWGASRKCHNRDREKGSAGKGVFPKVRYHYTHKMISEPKFTVSNDVRSFLFGDCQT